jgi:hypothetical protein
MRAASSEPALRRGGEIRVRLPHRSSHRKLRERLIRLDYGDLVEHQPEPITKITNADYDRGAEFGVEH